MSGSKLSDSFKYPAHSTGHGGKKTRQEGMLDVPLNNSCKPNGYRLQEMVTLGIRGQ